MWDDYVVVIILCKSSMLRINAETNFSSGKDHNRCQSSSLSLMLALSQQDSNQGVRKY